MAPLLGSFTLWDQLPRVVAGPAGLPFIPFYGPCAGWKIRRGIAAAINPPVDNFKFYSKQIVPQFQVKNSTMSDNRHYQCQTCTFWSRANRIAGEIGGRCKADCPSSYEGGSVLLRWTSPTGGCDQWRSRRRNQDIAA
jgi:hypothetical protein